MFFADCVIVTSSQSSSISPYLLLKSKLGHKHDFSIKNKRFVKLISVESNAENKQSVTNLVFQVPPCLAFDQLRGILYMTSPSSSCIFSLTVKTGKVDLAAGNLNDQQNKFLNGHRVTEASFSEPRCITVDRKGNLYVTDSQTVRKVDFSTDLVTTHAGVQQTSSYDDEEGMGNQVALCYPAGIAVDKFYNLYYNNAGTKRQRRISPTGYVSNLPQFEVTNSWPSSVCVDELLPNMVYFGDRDKRRIIKVEMDKATHSKVVANRVFFEHNEIGYPSRFQLYGMFAYNGTVYVHMKSKILVLDQTGMLKDEIAIQDEPALFGSIVGNVADSCLYISTSTGVYRVD